MKFLNPKFRFCPPTDVRFWFKDEGGAVKEVKAHTNILAAASDVFYREFYGSFRVENDIEVKDASQEVFLAMIEFIYNKKLVFKDVSLSFLASLYYLADKYNLEDLRDEIVAFIPELKITKDNVLEVARLAEDNILHQSLSGALYDAAARFVKKDKGVVDDLCTDGNEEYAMVIFKLIKRSNKVKSDLCGNCQQATCLTGQQLTRDNFVKGAKVEHTSVHFLAVLISANEKTFSFKYGEDGIVERLIYTGFVYKCD